MPALRMAKASIHMRRRLQPNEVYSIAVALELLVREPASARLQDIRVAIGSGEALISDERLRALSQELIRARKVKVCRTKHKES